jgi:Bacterial membrane flanked domain.
MNPEQPSPSDYDKPVAYDAEGQPLYAHPSLAQEQTEIKTQVVHEVQTTDPEKEKLVISDVARLKHDQSKQTFPELNLSESEYVISAIKRHSIGLFMPFVAGVFLITLAFILLLNYDLVTQAFQLTGDATNPSVIILPVILFTALVVIGVYVAYYVYTNNKFFLTNESIIQEVQTGPFSKREKTVSLANIEDASYTQDGIIQQFFNYGSIRITIEGNETTYRFSYVANPKEHIATLNNAVEAFKSVQPVKD